MIDVPVQPDSIRALLRQRDYVLFWISRFSVTLAVLMQSVTMGWQIYEIARQTHTMNQSALYVGLLGLCTFLPLIVLALPGGEVADRHARKKVLFICTLIEIVCVAVPRLRRSRA